MFFLMQLRVDIAQASPMWSTLDTYGSPQQIEIYAVSASIELWFHHRARWFTYLFFDIDMMDVDSASMLILHIVSST